MVALAVSGMLVAEQRCLLIGIMSDSFPCSHGERNGKEGEGGQRERRERGTDIDSEGGDNYKEQRVVGEAAEQTA